MGQNLVDILLLYSLIRDHINTPFTMSKNDLDPHLDRDPEELPVYTRHSLFNTTKRITLLFIVRSSLYCNPPSIWIKIIQIAIPDWVFTRENISLSRSRSKQLSYM